MTVKKPQDRRKKREPFPFVIDGVEYALTVPTFGQVIDLQQAENEAVAVMEMIKGCVSVEGYEAIRSLDAPDVNELFDEWMGAVGGGAGKSSGSSD